jgi:AraC-like DNA-binding protein
MRMGGRIACDRTQLTSFVGEQICILGDWQKIRRNYSNGCRFLMLGGDSLEASFVLGQADHQVAAGLKEWNDMVGEAFCGCVVDATDQPFSGRLSSYQVDDLRLTCVRANASRVSRWLSSQPVRSSGSVLLHLQSAGQSVNQQCGRSLPVHSGEAAICDPDRRYQVDFLTTYEMFVLEVPVARLALREPGFDLERFAGQKVDPWRSQLLLAFLRAAWRHRRSLYIDTEWRECVSRTCVDLAIGAMARTGTDKLAGAPAEMRRTVIGYIRRNLADPGLRTSSVARGLGISPRSVQNVFEQLATTASAFILESRLDKAAERLALDARGSITELAFDCGFSDSAYFSRCFRDRFRVSPRDYRNQRHAPSVQSTSALVGMTAPIAEFSK